MLTKEQQHKAQMKILEQMWDDIEKAQALENHKQSQRAMNEYGLPYRVYLDYLKSDKYRDCVRINPCYPFPGYEVDSLMYIPTDDFIHPNNDGKPIALADLFSINALKDDTKQIVLKYIAEHRQWVINDDRWKYYFLHFLVGYDFKSFNEVDFWGTKGTMHPGDIQLLRNVYTRLQKEYTDNPGNYMQSEPLLSDYDEDKYHGKPFLIAWSREELEEKQSLEYKMKVAKESILSDEQFKEVYGVDRYTLLTNKGEE